MLGTTADGTFRRGLRAPFGAAATRALLTGSRLFPVRSQLSASRLRGAAVGPGAATPRRPEEGVRTGAQHRTGAARGKSAAAVMKSRLQKLNLLKRDGRREQHGVSGRRRIGLAPFFCEHLRASHFPFLSSLVYKRQISRYKMREYFLK